MGVNIIEIYQILVISQNRKEFKIKLLLKILAGCKNDIVFKKHFTGLMSGSKSCFKDRLQQYKINDMI